MSVEVVFETHSTSEDNEAGLATGWLPGKLSTVGREQARELGARRRGDGLSVAFTSALRRAVETAEIAFSGSPLPLVPDARLRECNYGELNGAEKPIETPGEHIDIPFSGGESWREAIERVAGFLAELKRNRDGERVLVIGHAATRWAIEVVVNGQRLEELLVERYKWQPGWEYVL